MRAYQPSKWENLCREWMEHSQTPRLQERATEVMHGHSAGYSDYLAEQLVCGVAMHGHYDASTSEQDAARLCMAQ